MSENYRHHHAVKVIIIPVPSAGSPAPLRPAKPIYPKRDSPTHWRRQRAIPSKAAATANLLRQIAQNEASARSMMRPQPPAPR
jgi:hypothetical protein